MKILIIEDESWVAEELSDTLQTIDNTIEIVKILSSVEEGKAYLGTAEQPDLVFSDIQLGDGLSFEIMDSGLINAPVIFCTAFDEYMLEAFDANGIAYILKPFTENAVKKSLNKYKDLQSTLNRQLTIRYDALLQNFTASQTQNSIVIKYRNRIIPVALDKIALCYIENGITYVYTHGNRKYVHNETMDELEQKLRPVFFRVNRQYLINKNAIKNAEEFFGRKLKVQLTFSWNEEITVSKEKKSKLLNWLQ